MTNVVKFENTRKQRLTREQELAMKEQRKKDRSRRDAKKNERHVAWEEVA
jgi:hypothetical protein